MALFAYQMEPQEVKLKAGEKAKENSTIYSFF